MLWVKQIMIWVITTVSLAGCIEEYYPDEGLKDGTLVVIAHLTSAEEAQNIFVSRSTDIQISTRNPVEGCLVHVERSDGSQLEFEGAEPGRYKAYFPDFFYPGEWYRLRVSTPDGLLYESDYELLTPVCEIDSLYWEKWTRPGPVQGKDEDGVQFYLDFELDQDSGGYLRWELQETYEIRSLPYERREIYDIDRQFKPVPLYLDQRTCWITVGIPQIFTQDVHNLEGSVYRKKTLNFVSGHSWKLKHRYCLQVRQYSLNREAFWYWENMKNNHQSGAGMYDRQPALTPGNICNPDDKGEVVIGYFSVSALSVKRIFVSDVPGLVIVEDPDFCFPGPLPYSFAQLGREFLPYFIATLRVHDELLRGSVKKECIDCSAYANSSISPPDFW